MKILKMRQHSDEDGERILGRVGDTQGKRTLTGFQATERAFPVASS